MSDEITLDGDAVEATVVEQVVAEELSDLDAARAESAQYLDDLKRLKAEFENFRKRVARDQTQIVERAAAGVIERLLPVLDNFDLALIAAGTTKDYDAMMRGVELVYSELRDTLRKEGLQRMEVLGQRFDPEWHEAIMHDGDGDTVIDEMRPGYLVGGRVVRPAMVKVGGEQTQAGADREQ